ncbi:MAG TPA: acyltransferase [Longimicrobiaceae bacterium]|nr:acyltransferase [Longimicrobiaceae bacterium]
MEVTPSPRSARHVPALDGLRGIAILLVLLRHLVLRPAGTPVDWLHQVTRVGWVGVDLFFVLSGYLITGILLDTRGRPGYLRTFWVRRALRILPLYYGFLAFYLWVIPHAYPRQAGAFAVLDRNQAWLWLYGNNLLSAVEGVHLSFGLSHFWSLAVEEQFYLVWPIVVLLLPRRALLRICGGLALGAALLRVALIHAGVPAGSIYGLTFTRMDGLLAGAAVAVLVRERGGARALLPAARWGASVGLAVLLALLPWAPSLMELSPWMQRFGYSALALFFASALVHCIAAPSGGALSKALNLRGLHFLGRHSYAIYVLHLPVLHFLLSSRIYPEQMAALLGGTLLVGRLAFFLVAAALSVAVSWVVWHLWERPFLRLKARFPYRAAAAESTSWSSTRPSVSRTALTRTSAG